jgi:hypothetical protein
MIFRKKNRDPDERPIFGMHPGDLGIVAVAVVITVVFFVMLLTPKDFAALDRALAPAAPKPKTANRLELLQIADAVAREKSIDRSIVIDAMEDAIAEGRALALWRGNRRHAEINPRRPAR